MLLQLDFHEDCRMAYIPSQICFLLCGHRQDSHPASMPHTASQWTAGGDLQSQDLRQALLQHQPELELTVGWTEPAACLRLQLLRQGTRLFGGRG